VERLARCAKSQRATTLVTDENVAVIVPNSQFISERVINRSRPHALTAYVLTFHLPSDSDPDLVRRTLLEAATGHERVLRSPAPEVEFV
jgi:small-conductance mechanosensitive channel